MGPCPDSGRRTDKAKAREPVGPPVGVDDVSPPQPKASRGGKRVVQPAAASPEREESLRQAVRRVKAMTPAERQAARRKKLKADPVAYAAYLEADRERKRK